MKNREWLNSMAASDVLSKINETLHAYRCDCIMDALDDENMERCGKYKGNCRNCIAAWLNEERR